MAIELYRLRSPLAILSFLDLRTWLYRLLNYMRGFTNVRVITESETVRIDDYIILIDEANATANITVTLPPLASCHTKRYVVRKVSDHVTHQSFVSAFGSEVIYFSGFNASGAEFSVVGATAEFINAEQVWFFLS